MTIPALSACVVKGPPKSLPFCECPAWNSERQCLQRDLLLLNQYLSEDRMHEAGRMFDAVSDSFNALKRMLP